MTNEIIAVDSNGADVVVSFSTENRYVRVVLAKRRDGDPMFDGPISRARPRIIDGALQVWGERFQVDTALVAPVIEVWNSRPPDSAQPAHRGHLTPLAGAPRFQYLVADIGMFNAAERMTSTLAKLGEAGWELVHTYDKASNWFGGMEKGFMMFKRPVPDGVDVERWAFSV